ncbi:hypothetical protein [Sporosarcina sp. ZBG7A]|uniref:hypothetical protein n=1 Tax=Sporosarcina sp. ZBG7A TaxID=1582223 RepID=UPI00057A05B0|nr:hypothetical protein [Sporosarcina sp. ZBG7A]
MILNLKARALTKMEHYEEALSLFNSNPIQWNDRIQMNPIDTAVRTLSGSYEALCHHHLGSSTKAQALAQNTVKRLQVFPHSPFYQFACNQR